MQNSRAFRNGFESMNGVKCRQAVGVVRLDAVRLSGSEPSGLKVVRLGPETHVHVGLNLEHKRRQSVLLTQGIKTALLSMWAINQTITSLQLCFHAPFS